MFMRPSELLSKNEYASVSHLHTDIVTATNHAEIVEPSHGERLAQHGGDRGLLSPAPHGVLMGDTSGRGSLHDEKTNSTIRGGNVEERNYPHRVVGFAPIRGGLLDERHTAIASSRGIGKENYSRKHHSENSHGDDHDKPGMGNFLEEKHAIASRQLFPSNAHTRKASRNEDLEANAGSGDDTDTNGIGSFLEEKHAIACRQMFTRKGHKKQASLKQDIGADFGSGDDNNTPRVSSFLEEKRGIAFRQLFQRKKREEEEASLTQDLGAHHGGSVSFLDEKCAIAERRIGNIHAVPTGDEVIETGAIHPPAASRTYRYDHSQSRPPVAGHSSRAYSGRPPA